MTTSNPNIITIIFTASLILHLSHGEAFQVIQPHNQMVNTDGAAFITCEHTANVTSVEDVQLNGISSTGKPTRRLLCQKGMKDCKDIIMHLENPNRCLFIMLNIGPEAMDMKYECEFTVKVNDLEYTANGTPTTLLPGEKVKVCENHSTCPAQSYLLRWSLIALLALASLYSCVITTAYVRLRFANKGPENSTYVEMRKKPPPRNPTFMARC